MSLPMEMHFEAVFFLSHYFTIKHFALLYSRLGRTTVKLRYYAELHMFFVEIVLFRYFTNPQCKGSQGTQIGFLGGSDGTGLHLRPA